MSRFVNPQPRYVDDNGKSLVGGKLFFYSAGTVTPRDTYSDAGFTIKNTNPVNLDANGRPETNIFLDGAYKVVLKTENLDLVWEKDPVGGAIGVAAFDDWINDATYDRGQIVTGSDGNYYVSLTNGNIGLDPTVETDDWERVQVLVSWRSDVLYQQDDLVVGSDDILYKSLTADNTNNDPISDQTNWSSVKDYWGVANGVATLDSDGLVPSAQIPPIAITDVYVVANQAARLALDAQVGDIAVQNDNNLAYILQSLPASTNANWIDFGVQNFGTAAFRDIGTGTDQVPDKEILDTRLGTTGNLGDAATRTVGTDSGNVPAYAGGSLGLSLYGYGGTVSGNVAADFSSINSTYATRVLQIEPAFFGMGSGTNRVVGWLNKGAINTRWSWLGVTDSSDLRAYIANSSNRLTGESAELWHNKNLSNPATTDTNQTITGIKSFNSPPRPVSNGGTNLGLTGTRWGTVYAQDGSFTNDVGISGDINVNSVYKRNGLKSNSATIYYESAGSGGQYYGGFNTSNNYGFAVGVGSNNPFEIYVANGSYGSETYSRFMTADTDGNVEFIDSVTAPNVIATTLLRSDPKLKTKRVKADVTREQLDSLTLWYFEWRQDRKGVPEHLKGQHDIGVMADAVAKVFPECVYTLKGIRHVDYAKLGVCLTLADMKLRREGK